MLPCLRLRVEPLYWICVGGAEAHEDQYGDENYGFDG
jgi:hypothetical protein